MEPDVISGAEAQSWDGDRRGVLVIHGFTGSTQSMRPLAEAFATDGMTVEMPRLPGHGTSVEDMLTTDWSDWSAEVERAYERLAAKVDGVVVAGLSMGGTLSIWAASKFPMAGLVTINAAAQPQPEVLELVDAMLASGEIYFDPVAGDIKKEGVVEIAYEKTPLLPLKSLSQAVDGLQSVLGSITCPALLFVSPDDHVVPAVNSAHLATSLGGTVQTVELPNSYHVATLDNDAETINTRAVAFANEVLAPS